MPKFKCDMLSNFQTMCQESLVLQHQKYSSDFRQEQIVLYYFMIEAAEVRWHHFRHRARELHDQRQQLQTIKDDCCKIGLCQVFASWSSQTPPLLLQSLNVLFYGNYFVAFGNKTCCSTRWSNTHCVRLLHGWPLG